MHSTSQNAAFSAKPPELASWRYDHAGPGHRPEWRIWLSALLGVVALTIGLSAFGTRVELGRLFPALVMAAIAIGVLLASERKLQLGSRFLICGDKLIYFANIDDVALSRHEGILTLRSQNKTVLKVERKRFASRARKAAKIEQHQQAKFDRVSARIVAAVLAANPAVELKSDGGRS